MCDPRKGPGRTSQIRSAVNRCPDPDLKRDQVFAAILLSALFALLSPGQCFQVSSLLFYVYGSLVLFEVNPNFPSFCWFVVLLLLSLICHLNLELFWNSNMMYQLISFCLCCLFLVQMPFLRFIIKFDLRVRK